jgi:hypothetical protein
MAEFESIQDVLNDFRDNVIREAKSNLSSRTDSGNLKKSLKSFVKESKNSIQISFEMDEYGFYQDQGVKGKDPSKVSPNAKIKGQQAPNSQFRFGSGKSNKTFADFQRKMAAWAQRKNVRFRDSKGRFSKGGYKSIGYIIASNIYNRGLKPTLFFTKPFEKFFKRLPDELVEKYGLDIENLFNQITSENFKRLSK